MVSSVKCSTLIGNESAFVEVEAHILGNLRKFSIVGLPDSQLRESKERVRCAVENAGFEFPGDEVVVNLGPASVPKVGAGFDLAVAISVLIAAKKIPETAVRDRLFLGELGLDGSVRKCAGVLHAARLCGKTDVKEIWVPSGNVNEALLVRGVKVVAVDNLRDAAMLLRGSDKVRFQVGPSNLDDDELKLETFQGVRGHYACKRAMEIVAGGGHNLLMVGPPGSGKTMLAKRLPSILPPLGLDEMVELTCLNSFSGKVVSLCRNRPFRAPHHTSSGIALVGGGSVPRPGEISLAHKGVLFLDELAEFKKSALDCLRQPLEEQQITVTRANGTAVFPADFTLVAAMNPPDNTYFERSITKHLSKISRPLLDRIELQVWVNPPTAKELDDDDKEDLTYEIRERVCSARIAQSERFGEGVLNSRVTVDCIQLDKDARQLLGRVVEKKAMSPRARAKAIRVARTVADLDQSQYVCSEHVSEAVSYRML